jgi:hypothetical protein
VNRLIPVLVTLALAACAGTPERGEMRQYTCDDGTAFSLEVTDRLVRVRTVTGPIELPRTRHPDFDAYFTNGLRTIILDEDGRARHSTGRRAWTHCAWTRVAGQE